MGPTRDALEKIIREHEAALAEGQCEPVETDLAGIISGRSPVPPDVLKNPRRRG
jgi:hypothetical protein